MSAKNRSVYVIGPTFGFDRVLPKYGYTAYTDTTIANLSGDPDFVAFMGGVDVAPDVYGASYHPATQHPNHARDAREISLWKKYAHLPKWGICRGAQLLNVLNGGGMYQHVNNHNGANHLVRDYKNREVVVCSVHHQMMLPSINSKLIAWSEGVSTRREIAEELFTGPTIEPEVLFISQDKALCFQAHPEFGPKSCTDYFFQLVEELYPDASPT